MLTRSRANAHTDPHAGTDMHPIMHTLIRAHTRTHTLTHAHTHTTHRHNTHRCTHAHTRARMHERARAHSGRGMFSVKRAHGACASSGPPLHSPSHAPSCFRSQPSPPRRSISIPVPRGASSHGISCSVGSRLFPCLSAPAACDGRGALQQHRRRLAECASECTQHVCAIRLGGHSCMIRPLQSASHTRVSGPGH
jgi:hypothetical protein